MIELNLINSKFLKNRAEPLKIGSVKSNMGHSETASALCSIVKAVLCLEGGVIAPNINFSSFPPHVNPKLVEKIQVSSGIQG